MAGMRAYLDGMGIVNTPGVEVDFLDALDLSYDGERRVLSGFTVDSVGVQREDRSNTTELLITSTVSHLPGDDPGSRTPVQLTERVAYVIEPGNWQGLNFAMLANNVNCIMCHAEIGSSDRFYNQDPALYGTFQRVKVGTLENLLLRDKAASSIMGSLYVRGLATDKSGMPISDWAIQTLDSHLFDAKGDILQDDWGQTSQVDLVAAGASPGPMENLYLDYPSDPADMVDGYLPTSFPPPIPDDGGIDPATGLPDPAAVGNRQVDLSEFLVAAADAQGKITGGTIYVVPSGSVIDTAGKLFDAQTLGNQATLAAVTTGNVFLTGTASEPILIDDDLAINGDLVIKGYVKGEGSLTVSGNVYIPTDLVYLDGTDEFGRTFGVASDGTQNALAIASGGSIVVGDLYYQKKGEVVTGDETGSFNFVLSEIALFNRSEWAKTQAVLPGVGENLNDPATWTVVNSAYDPDYLPRYYSFVEKGTIPIYNKGAYYDKKIGGWVGKEHPGKWDLGVLTYANPKNPGDPLLYAPDGSRRAAVQSLTAANGWLTDGILAQMMVDAVADRPAGTPLGIDSLMYSNNSIFGIVAKSGSMQGQMIVNGAIVAADIGLLVPGNGGVGLQLNFDIRTSSLLNLQSGDGISFRRLASVNSGTP